MGQISSINFKKSNPIQTKHNDRYMPPNYLIGGDFEVNISSFEALNLKAGIVNKAQEAYTKRTGQKFQAKSYEWSAVVNLKPTSSMEDLAKLAKYFKDKFGFQCYQMAIHRDEGHFNDQGEKVINHHAHLEFITLDEKTGKNNYNRQNISPSVLRQIQSEVAEILEMERGQDKRVSKRERIEPRKYAQMKEAEKENIKKAKKEAKAQNIELERQILKDELARELEQNYLSKKEVKEFIENFRKQCIGEGLPKEFFIGDENSLKTIKNEALSKENPKQYTLELLNETLTNLVKLYKEEKKKRLEEEATKEKQAEEINSLRNELLKKDEEITIIIQNNENLLNSLEARLEAEKEKNEELLNQINLNANLTPQNNFKGLYEKLKVDYEALKLKNKELKVENGMLKRIIFAFAKAYEGSIIYSVMGKMRTKFKSWLALDNNTKKSKETKQDMSKDQLLKTIQTLREYLSNSKSQAKSQGFSR